jgi:hypothetical protein
MRIQIRGALIRVADPEANQVFRHPIFSQMCVRNRRMKPLGLCSEPDQAAGLGKETCRECFVICLKSEAGRVNDSGATEPLQSNSRHPEDAQRSARNST